MRATYLLAAAVLAWVFVTHARAEANDPAQVIVHMLDYVAVDYGEAVEEGKVKNEDEFKEMQEFTSQVTELLKGLPANPRQGALVSAAQSLAHLVAAKGQVGDVAEAASKLRWAVIEGYGVQVAPKEPPSLARAAPLYQAHCATCHGAAGEGDGPAAKGLTPAPSNFHDTTRMMQRSVYGLYNTITLGVGGTAMAPFKHVSEADRWALAFFVANYATHAGERARGAALWKAGTGKEAFRDIGNVVTLSPHEVKARFGDDAALVQAHLIAAPQAIAAAKPAPIDFAIATIAAAARAHRAGEHAQAQQLAIAAYLDGFEIVEGSLQNIDAPLVREIEAEMMAFRNLVRAGAPAHDVDQQAAHVDALLKKSAARLADENLTPGTTLLSAFLILLREGIEALLVVAAIIAFLTRSNRRDALPYVHAGWVGAIALGFLTWAIATYVVDISGANREITEGVTALIAAVMLVYVGYWLHSKSTARAWQGFIKQQVGAALEGRTLWTLALVSFVAVYREMFETVLFYQALWVQAGDAGRGAFIAGVALAVAGLAVLAWAIFKWSVRLPLAPFFTATSILLCVLAVVLAGKGIAALQEAGTIPADLVSVPAIPMLGIFPTLQGLAVQIALVFLVLGAFWLSSRAQSAEKTA